MESSSDTLQTVEFVSANIVKIVNRDGTEFYGTGFCLFINQQKFIITCHHCIRKLDQIFIEKDEIQYPCKWIEEYSDYAIPINTLLIKFNQDNKILKAQPNINTKEHLEKGNLFYEKRNLNDAIEQYNKIIAADVNYLNALSNKGKCLIELGKNLEAIEIFKIVLDINSNFLYALNGMSDALNYLGKFRESIEFCDKALNIDPNFVYALNTKGLALNNLGKYEEAVEWYDKALNIDPNFVYALANKGLALVYLEKYEEAVEWYDKALKINPNSVHALITKGLTLNGLRKYEEAIQLWDKVLKIDPNDEFTRYQRFLAIEHLSNEKPSSYHDTTSKDTMPKG
jgi:tetratricopeptide (TPR) repeat protein